MLSIMVVGSFGLGEDAAAGRGLLGATAKPTVADQQVLAVRQEVVWTNSRLSTFSKRTQLVENVSLEGTEATYYRSGKRIRKIVASVFGETYRARIDFYYSGNRLIYAYDRHSTYEAGLGSPVRSTVNYQMYFHRGRVVRVLADSKELSADESAAEVTAIEEMSRTLRGVT